MAIFHIYLCLHLRVKFHIAMEVIKEVRLEIYDALGPKECKVARLWRGVSVTTQDPRIDTVPSCDQYQGCAAGSRLVLVLHWMHRSDTTYSMYLLDR